MVPIAAQPPLDSNLQGEREASAGTCYTRVRVKWMMLPYLRHRRSGTPWYDRLWTQHATQAAITSRRPHGRHHDGSRDCYLYFRGGRALRLALAAILRSHSRGRARRADSASERTYRTLWSTTGWRSTTNRGAGRADPARATGADEFSDRRRFQAHASDRRWPVSQFSIRTLDDRPDYRRSSP